MKSLYTHPQETWDAKKCKEMARQGGVDYFGTKQRPGLIASSASSYPQYGQTIRFNGGRIIGDELYQSEYRPLPKIAKGYKFKKILSWGTYIVKA